MQKNDMKWKEEMEMRDAVDKEQVASKANWKWGVKRRASEHLCSFSVPLMGSTDSAGLSHQ